MPEYPAVQRIGVALSEYRLSRSFGASSRLVSRLRTLRFFADPDHTKAEFAVLVRSDLKGRGLGRRHMAVLIDCAKSNGLSILTGSVLEVNTVMLRMCRELGFTIRSRVDEPGVLHVQLDLNAAPKAAAAAR